MENTNDNKPAQPKMLGVIMPAENWTALFERLGDAPHRVAQPVLSLLQSNLQEIQVRQQEPAPESAA